MNATNNRKSRRAAAKTAKIGDNTGMAKLNVQLNEIGAHSVKEFDQQLRLIVTLHGMGELVPYKYLSTGNATVSIDTALNEWLRKNAADSFGKFADIKDQKPSETANTAQLTKLGLDKQAAGKRMAAMRRMMRDSVQIVYMLHHIGAEQLKISGTGTRKVLSYTAHKVTDWKVEPKSSERVTDMSTTDLQRIASSFIAKMAGSTDEKTASQKRKAATDAKKAEAAKKQQERTRETGAGSAVINTMGTLAAELAKPMPTDARDKVIASPAFDADLKALVAIKFVAQGPTLANAKRKFDLAALIAWVKHTFQNVDFIEPLPVINKLVKSDATLSDGNKPADVPTDKPKSAAAQTSRTVKRAAAK